MITLILITLSPHHVRVTCIIFQVLTTGIVIEEDTSCTQSPLLQIEFNKFIADSWWS